MTEDCRQAFEEWAARVNPVSGLEGALKKKSTGEYLWSGTSLAWEAFQAGRASIPAPEVTEKWYGYAGHLCVAHDCAYHLCTRIGGYLISTVGHYIPRLSDSMTTIGSGENDYFETYAFVCSGEDEDGNPILTNGYSEIDGERYATSNEAEAGKQ